MIPSQLRPSPSPNAIDHRILLRLTKNDSKGERGGFDVPRRCLSLGGVLDLDWDDVGIVDELVELAAHRRLDVILWWIRMGE
jgi:hypothetical protein